MVDDGLTTDISREDWEAVIATDLTGPFSLPTHAPARRPLLRALHGPPRHNAPEGVRLLMIRADGTFMVWADGGGPSVKPLNWMSLT